MKICTVCQELEANLDDIKLYCSRFLKETGDECGFPLEFGSPEEVMEQGITPVPVESGGSERNFLKLHESLKWPYLLITVPAFNSLAASLEMKGFLDARGEKSEVLHGSIRSIADRIRTVKSAADASGG